MSILSDRRRMWAVIGALAGVVIIVTGLLFLVTRDRPATPGPTLPTTTTSPSAATMTVWVYFHKGAADDPARVAPVERTAPKTDMVATAALRELLGGPTTGEHAAGYWSQFTSATAGQLRGVRVDDGVAYADFHDFSQIIPNASSSFGSTALLAELDATLKQFATVQSTVYSFNGNVDAFYEWLQLAPPIGTPGDQAAAIAAARQFLTAVVGMNNPVAGPLRRTSDSTAEVTFHARGPNGDPVLALATVVSLRRDGRWMVTETGAATILVDSPASSAMISSPVWVSGRAHAFEGHVTVRVLAGRDGTTVKIGQGFVTGGGDQLWPFHGEITFIQPSGGTGWLIFTEESAANGETILATSVRIAFPPQPLPPA
jgi:hypothetical protein